VDASQVVLVEEPLLFNQYGFHRQKLIFHRATMMQFAADLRERRRKVHYVAAGTLADTSAIAATLKQLHIQSVQYVDPCDDWLSTRLAVALEQQGIAASVLDDPHFLTPLSVIRDFTVGKERLYFTGFYIAQRKRLGLLPEKDRNPGEGQWNGGGRTG